MIFNGRNKEKEAALKVFPALLPSMIGLTAFLVFLGGQIGQKIHSLIGGYFVFLVARLLIELIEGSNDDRNNILNVPLLFYDLSDIRIQAV